MAAVPTAMVCIAGVAGARSASQDSRSSGMTIALLDGARALRATAASR
jgi:uncharacterized metal-binding protein